MSALIKCTRCHEPKARDEFHRDSARPNGLQCWCKSCKAWWARESPAAREARRRHWERIKSDPERHAQRLANQRIDWRLRAEQSGRIVIPRSVKDVRTGKRRPIEYDDPRLPIEPFVAVLRSVGENSEQIARRLGFDDNVARVLRRYFNGESQRVRRSIVERVCERCHVDPADIYPEAYAA